MNKDFVSMYRLWATTYCSLGKGSPVWTQIKRRITTRLENKLIDNGRMSLGQSKSTMKRRTTKRRKPENRKRGRNTRNRGPMRPRVGQGVVRQAPVNLGFVNRSKAPMISGSGTTKTVVHREIIAVLSGGSDFKILSLPLNPGLRDTFQWLSSEATTYEMYRWNSLSFEYEPSTTTVTKGTVMIAIDFDSSDVDPASENELMNHCDAVSGPPWGSILYRTAKINFDRQFPNKFCRFGNLTNGQDIHSFDLGKLVIGTVGQVDTDVVGRIYATYSVTFQIPALPTVGLRGTFRTLRISNGATNTGNPFGDGTEIAYGSIPYNLNTTGDILTFSHVNPGKIYFLHWRAIGQFSTAPVLTLVGGVYLNFITYNSTNGSIPATELIVAALILVDAPGDGIITITRTSGFLVTFVTFNNLSLYEIESSTNMYVPLA
jgi:hypothetical protein